MSAEVEVIAIRDGEAELRVGGRQHFVPFIIRGSEVSFAFEGEVYTVETGEKNPRARARHREQTMSAPMPGVVLKVLVESNAVVEKGTPLIILEAMKMEHTIAATRDGRVVAVHCKEGEMVQPGVELIEME
jgi:3-methylcrotonyl-CoA carboxylase alpha subunit